MADSGSSPETTSGDRDDATDLVRQARPGDDQTSADSSCAAPGRPPSPRATVDANAIARRLSRLSSTEVACDFLRHHLDDHPLDVEAHVLAAMYCAELDRVEEAFEWGRRAVFLAPDAPYVIFVLADICARCHRIEGYRRYTQWARKLLRDRHGGDILQYSSGCTVDQLREVLDVHHR